MTFTSDSDGRPATIARSPNPAPTEADRLDESEVAELADHFEDWTAEAILAWAGERFGERLVISTSFQAEGMVILDMAWRLNPRMRVVTVDSGRLPQETYDLIDQVRDRYGIAVEVFSPDPAELEPFVRAEGMNPFYRSVPLRLRCCEIRKVNPQARALAGAGAWVAGQRRDQSATRTRIRKIEHDTPHGGIIKLNPLADWTEQQVWAYIHAHDVPYNALYDAGYTSIGCAPCTRPTRSGEDPRAGRWWWEKDTPKECGINFVHGRIEPQHRSRERAAGAPEDTTDQEG